MKFMDLMVQYGLDAGMVRELAFAPPKRWRFDFAWPSRWFAVEVEGMFAIRHGNTMPSHHRSTVGFMADAVKYEAAMLAGWIVYRVPSLWLRDRKDEIVAVVNSMLQEDK